MKNKVILVLWSLLLIAVTFITTTQIHISEIDNLKQEIVLRDSLWKVYDHIFPPQREALLELFGHSYIRAARNYIEYKDQYEKHVEEYKKHMKRKREIEDLIARGMYKPTSMRDPSLEEWLWRGIMGYRKSPTNTRND